MLGQVVRLGEVISG